MNNNNNSRNPLRALLFWLAATIGCGGVDAVEVLPTLTIKAPRPTLHQRINNSQWLDESELTIAHERSIPDVIQGFPGISSTKVGAFGQAGVFYIRGAAGQGVITLDGLPLLQSIPGLFALDNLPTEAIETAEIIRGPDSAYRAFQSLGGGVHLTTQDRPDTGGGLSVEGGSFGLLRTTLQAGGAGEIGRVTATVSRTDAFDGMQVTDPERNPERDPAHFTQGILRFSADVTQKLNWQGSLLYRKSGARVDTYGLDPQGIVVGVDDLNGQAHEETWLAQNTWTAQLTADWRSQLQLGYTQMGTYAQTGGIQNKVFTRLYLANWLNRHTLFDDPQQHLRWQLHWGAQSRHELGESTTSAFSQRRTMIASFIQTEAQIGNVSGEAGVRVEQFDQYGDRPLFKAALAWRVTPDLTLRASGGTGFRLPSYTELLFLFFANKNLKPERSVSGDLGLEWYPVKDLQLTVNGFYQRYDDLITIGHEPFAGPVSINIPDASVAGMELALRYGWSDHLTTGLSYTYSDSRDLQNDRDLPIRPRHIARVWGEQKLTAWPVFLWAEAIIRSSAWNDFGNTLPVDGSTQINAAIRYAVANNVELYLRGENLTNSRTPQVFTANMPGIAVYGGFKVDF